jgi:cellulose synthase/poly-beta-1,6-N-acetylglucosamine synthase-like glycosyltransferase
MGLKLILFRLLGFSYLALFVIYFTFRARYSLGETHLYWRWAVLGVEFLASISVVFVVIVRLRLPWTEYAHQLDGYTLTSQTADKYLKLSPGINAMKAAELAGGATAGETTAGEGSAGGALNFMGETVGGTAEPGETSYGAGMEVIAEEDEDEAGYGGAGYSVVDGEDEDEVDVKSPLIENFPSNDDISTKIDAIDLSSPTRSPFAGPRTPDDMPPEIMKAISYRDLAAAAVDRSHDEVGFVLQDYDGEYKPAHDKAMARAFSLGSNGTLELVSMSRADAEYKGDSDDEDLYDSTDEYDDTDVVFPTLDPGAAAIEAAMYYTPKHTEFPSEGKSQSLFVPSGSIRHAENAYWTPSRSVTFNLQSPSVETVYSEELNPDWDKHVDPRIDEGQYVPQKRRGYAVRVLIPCYKESLNIVRNTCLSALRMDYPSENIYVYLCDDGNDKAKFDWVMSMKPYYPNLFYVTRPDAFKGHGKAGNLNYTLQEIIYKGSKKIQRKEVIAILDADMVAFPNFMTRTLPYFSENKRVVMVQTPQTFHNVPLDADFFDAHNTNFFQYMLPAMSEWNLTTCCGTNFVVASAALRKVGWFPTNSITEDMYLAIKLLSRKGRIMYHGENLTIGEAPQDVRQIFQQRSRWAKGTMQIFFRDNPLVQGGLNWMQKLMFFNAGWSYITSAFMNPLFVFINAVGICLGLFPVQDLDFTTALLFVLYYVAFYGTIHFTPNPSKHYVSLWIVGKMGHFFSFMAMKAIFNVLKAFCCKKELTFKATAKKVDLQQDDDDDSENEGENEGEEGEDMDELEDDEFDMEMESGEVEEEKRDSTHKDIYYHVLMCLFIVGVIGYGIYLLLEYPPLLPELGGEERSNYQKRGIRMFLVVWMFQFLIAYSLPLWYVYGPKTFSGQSSVLSLFSKLDTFISIMMIAFTVMLFKVPFLLQLPELQSISDYPPNSQPLWFTDMDSSRLVGQYIHQSAVNQTIPVIVVYARPGRDVGGFSEGGITDNFDYLDALEGLANTLEDKNFPAVVILEPGWMNETLFYTRNANDQFIISNNDANSTFLSYDQERWIQLLTFFEEFAVRVPDKVNVYIDAMDPHYHQGLMSEALLRLNSTITDTTVFSGLSLNVGGYYPSDEVLQTGTKMATKFGWRFIEDSSRNGGLFSSRSMEEINSCRYDPPEVQQGIAGRWVNGTELDRAGMDAYIWAKIPGESDGRLYEFGTIRDCLIGHTQECNDVCPEIPPVVNEGFSRIARCRCDAFSLP